jgi:NAD(P)H-dependent FMN reductase
MIALIAGTNRASSNTLKVARQLAAMLEARGQEVRLLDLRELPPTVFSPDAYRAKPPELAPFQEAVLAADGILTVVPEYNGSFPGALKLFIDMLKFPESLVDKPAAFVGLADGRWAGLRAVEQLEMVFQYRSAHLYGRRVFIPAICNELDEEGRLRDPELVARLEALVAGFVRFCG